MTPPRPLGRKPQGVVLLLCIVPFLLILFLASHSPRLAPQGGSRHHRRLKLHPRISKSSSSGAAPVVDGGQQQQHHHHHTFDLVIAEVEHRLEDKEWEHYRLLHGGDGDGGPDEHMKEWEEFLKKEEDLINDDDRFNLDDRIRSLFPKIDIAQWNFDQAKANQIYRSGREMELYDRNGDGIISFEEFKARREQSRSKMPEILCFYLGDWL
jgi:calumenin